MIRSNLCKYNYAYVHVKATTVPNTAAAGVLVNNTNKKLIFKNCALFINFISRVNNTKVDDAQDIDVVKPMYNLIKYSDTYSKISGSLWQFYRDNNNKTIITKTIITIILTFLMITIIVFRSNLNSK